jgi:hypothetical protein
MFTFVSGKLSEKPICWPRPENKVILLTGIPQSSKACRSSLSKRLALPRFYPTMDIEQIKQLPVGDIAEEDAILWRWTTNAYLNMAFDVVEAWGFEYKTLLTWGKDGISRSVLRSPRRNTGRPRAASKQGSA